MLRLGFLCKWDRFRPFWPRLLGPEPQPQKGRISLKFLVETRLKSGVFEPWVIPCQMNKKLEKLTYHLRFSSNLISRYKFSCWFQQTKFFWNCLTLWEAIYEYIVPGFQPKTSSFRLPYQHHISSSTYCARELFKPSKHSASLLLCTQKKFFGWGLWICCEWRHKWSSFGVILAHVTWPRAQPLGQSVSLKFSLETRLESNSFEPLINFLTFLVQKLWSKINKLINYLIT